ncbi:NADAR family protein [Leptolyngbya sp. BL0902]|uniref:NADAR family protein n=1 Tax=Leptolyngbya sp. BL0902 TaxID=1115757 RepID=UPI001CEC6A97|nr:NADAR family protein [Leptolyngbya sp. BL0902]
MKFPETRTYTRQESITFRKTAERFGGLSNMAGGYLLNVNGVKILTSEALYQACRFPHLPEVQRQIIAERSPMTAKMRSKPYRDNSRSDWDIVRTKIMRWCLQVKLVQNWEKFSKLLLETGDLPIVEDSRKDSFWGAKPEDEEILVGANVLGRLLMQLREQMKNEEITPQTIINPLPISDFLLYGREINSISKDGEYYLAKYSNFLEDEATSSHLNLSSSGNEAHSCDERNLAFNLEEDLVNQSRLEFDEYDSLQFILPHIVESLQKAERTDKELAELFKTNLAQMREWLKRAVQLRKIRKISKPVRYVAESQLPLIR